jgi:hypothetical protein
MDELDDILIDAIMKPAKETLGTSLLEKERYNLNLCQAPNWKC